MKLTKPHSVLPATNRGRRAKKSAVALAVLSVVATSMVAVLSQVQSASASGKPVSSNTGVPAGTHLKVYNGDLTITRAGAVYDSLDIRGFVYVKAPNVVLKRSIVRGGVAHTSTGLVNANYAAATNFHIRDVELTPQHPSVYIDGIVGWNYRATRLNIHGTVDGAKVYGDNVTISSSYIHDLQHYMDDPYQGGSPTHNDGIQVLGGRHILIQWNNIVLASFVNAAMEVSQNHGATSDLQFMKNWADGGTCTVNMTNKPLASMSGITVNGNHFGVHTPLPCTIVAKPGVNFTAVGNMMDATDTPARVRVM